MRGEEERDEGAYEARRARGGGGWHGGGRNGCRARCPYRAARVMRVGIMAARAGRAGDRPSRRVRGPAAHRAADRAAACKTLSVCYLPSRAPRRWRGGAMGTSRPTAKPHEGCARQRGTTMGHGRCARQRGTTTGYGRGVRDAKPRTAVANRHGRGARAGGFSPLGARGGCLRLEQGRWKRRRSWARKGGRRLHPIWNQPD